MGILHLGLQPRRDGRIVFATMSKGFVLRAFEVYPTPTHSDVGLGPDDLDDEEKMMLLMKMYFEAEAKRLDTWPEIAWWDFDPDTGKITEMPTPDGLIGSLKDLGENQHFRWRMNADESMTMVGRD